MSKTVIHVLCSTDENYAVHCATMLASLFYHNEKNQVVAHILEKKLSDETKSKLLSIAKDFGQIILFHSLTQDMLSGLVLRQDSVVSLAAYYRLLVARIIDRDVDKILYLDCDMIVKTDLSELFAINMRSYPIAAVRDMCAPKSPEHALAINMSYGNKYFNSGMLLINLKMWRENQYEVELLNVAQELKSRFYHDQDPLNVVFRDNWIELSPSWNRFHLIRYYHVHFENKYDMLQYIYSPNIIHYANPVCRPWYNLKFVPFSKDYFLFRSMTPWRNYPLMKVDKAKRYGELLRNMVVNFVFRAPIIVKAPIILIYDLFLFLKNILTRFSLRKYANRKNTIRW